ncbi:MAG: phosphoribosyltransferase regulatory subunit HisZ [Pseudomonadota bacterium]
MSRAWLLPEHVADVLPAEASRVESLRRRLLDLAARHGFELVMPPLLEHVDSLLSGTAGELDLRTFKLVDQLSGRQLGLRADITPQAARIDAHLLNREGVVRLCYCGAVLHARPVASQARRELLQFGAEIFGHAGLEADLEVHQLALEVVACSGAAGLVVDLADARILRGVLAGVPLDAASLQELAHALSAKDGPRVRELSRALPAEAAQALQVLLGLYGGLEVLERAHEHLPSRPVIHQALRDLRRLAGHLRSTFGAALRVGFDLADTGGYAYYSGPRFSVYASGFPDALARGGRYDEVGAIFGRNRPAVGFSLDVLALAARAENLPATPAIRAAWSEEPGLHEAVRRLREQGEKVVYDLPGASPAVAAAHFDRQLVRVGERWAVQALGVCAAVPA